MRVVRSQLFHRFVNGERQKRNVYPTHVNPVLRNARPRAVDLRTLILYSFSKTPTILREAAAICRMINRQSGDATIAMSAEDWAIAGEKVHMQVIRTMMVSILSHLTLHRHFIYVSWLHNFYDAYHCDDFTVLEQYGYLSH